MDWFGLFAVQGTLKSLLQHHSSKASILQAFSLVQLSHPHMTTGKTTALTRQTFVGKVTSLLLNMPSQFVIPSLPRSKRLLISWLQSPSAVIYEPKKMQSVTISTVCPSLSHEVVGPDAVISGSPCPCTLTDIYPVVRVLLSPSCCSLKCSPFPALCSLEVSAQALSPEKPSLTPFIYIFL